MEAAANPYSAPIAFEAAQDERAAFVRRTYAHLTGAIVAFAALCAVIVTTPLGATISGWMMQSQTNWLIVLGLFIAASFGADRLARSEAGPAAQYAGLALFIVAEALIFTPLLYVAAHLSGDAGIIPAAGLITLLVFGGLTAYVFVTKQDFSFMRGALTICSFVALGVIVGSLLFGFALPTMLFAGAMIVLAAGYILYDTSNVLHHYRTDMHVAASLKLFASVALMFYYVLTFLLSLTSRD